MAIRLPLKRCGPNSKRFSLPPRTIAYPRMNAQDVPGSIISTSRKQQPLVTVGVPAWNQPTYLRRALACISGQTYSNLEILVSDDSDDEACAQVAREFASVDARIRYWRNPERRGLAGNFAKLLDEAHGTYFMWAAHDDWRELNYIEKLIECLEACPSGNLAIGFTHEVDLHTGQVVRHIDHSVTTVDMSLFERLRYLIIYNSNVWFYGIYRTVILRSARNLFTSSVSTLDIDRLVVMYCVSQGDLLVSPNTVLYKGFSPTTAGKGMARLYERFWDIPVAFWFFASQLFGCWDIGRLTQVERLSLAPYVFRYLYGCFRVYLRVALEYIGLGLAGRPLQRWSQLVCRFL